MKKRTLGIGAGIMAIMGLVFTLNQSGNDITECSDQFPDAQKEIVLREFSDWMDAERERFKSLSKEEGAPKIWCVFHHTATSEFTTSGELCEITDDRFSMGCSYAFNLHETRFEIRITQVTKIEAYTASVGNNNSRVISIAYVGNFDKKPLSEDMLKATCMLRWVFKTYAKQNPDFNFAGFALHNQFRNTACPGKHASKQLKEHGFIDKN